jgi:O-6-methylguanine DNA methyltransferase
MLMAIQIMTHFLSKQELYKQYPQLYYGVDGKWLILQTDDEKLCGLALLSFPNPYSFLTAFKRHTLIERKVHFPQAPHLLLAGTAFQHHVWKGLLELPPATVLSYQGLANHLQTPRAVRAVANAVGANPLPPLIPCHRIVGSHQHIGGYHWGLPAKIRLLQEEGVDLSSFKGLPKTGDKEYRESLI